MRRNIISERRLPTAGLLPVLTLAILGCSSFPVIPYGTWMYFDRETPSDAVRGFSFAVETENWVGVADCVVEEAEPLDPEKCRRLYERLQQVDLLSGRESMSPDGANATVTFPLKDRTEELVVIVVRRDRVKGIASWRVPVSRNAE